MTFMRFNDRVINFEQLTNAQMDEAEQTLLLSFVGSDELCLKGNVAVAYWQQLTHWSTQVADPTIEPGPAPF